MARNHPDMRKGGWRRLAQARRALQKQVDADARTLDEKAGTSGDVYWQGRVSAGKRALAILDKVILAAKGSRPEGAP